MFARKKFHMPGLRDHNVSSANRADMMRSSVTPIDLRLMHADMQRCTTPEIGWAAGASATIDFGVEQVVSQLCAVQDVEEAEGGSSFQQLAQAAH